MKEYSKVPIGKFAKVKGGKRLPKGRVIQDEKTAHPYIRVTDFHGGILDRESVKYIDEETHQKVKRYIITKDDVFISIAGTIGLVGIVPDDFSGANLTENAAKICEISSEVDKRYVALYLQSHIGQSEISGRVVGTSQPKLALLRIEEIEILLPPLPIQQKIADVLSAYDDLIEVNARRIRVLEAMAQSVYRETMRASSVQNAVGTLHATSPLPRGWEVKPFSELVEIDPTTSVDKQIEKPFVGMNALSTNSMVINLDLVEIRTGNSGAKFQNRDVLFPRITPSVENGKAGFVQFLKEGQVSIGSTEIIVFREKELNPEFIYFLSREHEFRGNAINSMVGASGRQRVQQSCFDAFLVAKPPKDLQQKFADIVSPMFKMVHTLTLKNTNLRRTRDLLLPRLVGGRDVAMQRLYNDNDGGGNGNNDDRTHTP